MKPEIVEMLLNQMKTWISDLETLRKARRQILQVARTTAPQDTVLAHPVEDLGRIAIEDHTVGNARAGEEEGITSGSSRQITISAMLFIIHNTKSLWRYVP